MEVSFPESDLLYNESLLAEVLTFLPPHDEALHLCEVYLEYGKFLCVHFFLSLPFTIFYFHASFPFYLPFQIQVHLYLDLGITSVCTETEER